VNSQNAGDFQFQANLDSDGSIDIRKYVFLIWQWLWLIFLIAALAGGLAFYISTRMVPIYATTTDLLVSEASSDRVSDYDVVRTSERLALTYSDLMVNEDILQEVIDKLSLQIVFEDLKDMVDIRTVRDTQIMKVTVEGTDPDQIANIANSIVSVFINRIYSIQAKRYASSIESLAVQLTEVEGKLKEVKSRLEVLDILTTTPTPAGEEVPISPHNIEREGLEAQELQYQLIYAELLTSYEQARLAETQSSANIIQINEATAPLKPIRPNILLNTIVAVIAALMLSMSFILVLDSLNDTINTPDDVSRILGTSVLGVIFEHKENSSVISQEDPFSLVSEAFRSLRTNLQFLNNNQEIKTILVTSPSQGSGKTLVSTNLAFMLAQSDKKVILVDVDLRRPTVHKKMNLPNENGITTALLNPDVSLYRLKKKTSAENLKVITSGNLPPNPSELLGSDRMKKIVEELKSKSGIVIFDAPPVLPVADAVAMSTLVDGVLLVLEPGVTTRTAARLTIQHLQRVNSKVIGVVFNNVKMKGQSYSYYYRSGYGYYQDSDYFNEQ